MPEITITCNDNKFFVNKITVQQYKQYTMLMEKNDSERLSDVMFFNQKIAQEIFGSRMLMEELGETDVTEVLTAAKAIHFVMQDIISPKFLELMDDGEPMEKEQSAFDEYDIENGYEEEQDAKSVWRTCSENIDRVVKIAIRLLKNSYSQCLEMDIVTLLDYVKFEIQTLNENQ